MKYRTMRCVSDVRGARGAWGRSATACLLLLSALCGCEAQGSSNDPSLPARLGHIRVVDPARVENPAEHGAALDLALEAEFWDMIVNSAHDHYDAYRAKALRYVELAPSASPRLRLLLTAGAVFQVSSAFEGEGPDWGMVLRHMPGIVDGSNTVMEVLPEHLPAQVFFHNNLSMRGLILGPLPDGLDHLEALIQVDGSEGRAAAPFTYGMLDDEAAVRYAISLNEGCETFVCDWTSQIAPFKPIGQLLMLAELHSVLGEFDEMDAYLDEAEALAIEREWPARPRIDYLRTELRARTYVPGAGQALGLGSVRWPMPVYSDGENCAGCHIGARAGQSGIRPLAPYAHHDTLTPTPAPPVLSHLVSQP